MLVASSKFTVSDVQVSMSTNNSLTGSKHLLSGMTTEQQLVPTNKQSTCGPFHSMPWDVLCGHEVHPPDTFVGDSWLACLVFYLVYSNRLNITHHSVKCNV